MKTFKKVKNKKPKKTQSQVTKSIMEDKELADQMIIDMKIYGTATFDRAISSAQDGLNNVIRRILYTCWKYNISKTSFTKILKLTGYVTGLHPHGDTSINSSIVTLTQNDLKMNYSYLGKKGHFGSKSDISAAQPRYIEVAMSDFGYDVITSLIDKHSLEFVEAEADYNEVEPKYLPTKIPLVLVNGGHGVALSFATSTPPHNLNEIADRCIKFIENKDITAKELGKGLFPDYPLGGTIINGTAIKNNYWDIENWKSITVRGEVEIDQKNNKIIIKEMPFSLKAPIDFVSLMQKLKDETVNKNSSGNLKNPVYAGISTISEVEIYNGGPVQVEVECKNGTNLVEILDLMYKDCGLQTSNGVNLTFHDDGQIRKCDIKDIISNWYLANKVIHRRKIDYNITASENKLHILEGIYSIYDKMDKVIDMIRSSKGNKEEIIEQLQKKFKLTLIQSKGIAEMQLVALSRRSKSQLLDDINNLKTKLTELVKSLNNIDQIMIDDLLFLKNKYGRPRRTKIIQSVEEREIVLSSGIILASRNNIGVFDPANCVSGKKILNGFKSVKIDGQWIKEIIDSKEIEYDFDKVLAFYTNGTCSLETPTFINSWVRNKNCNDKTFIKCICPIYKNIEGSILMTMKNGNIKRVDPNVFTSRTVNVGIVTNAIFIPKNKEKSEIVILDIDGKYRKYNVSDFSIKGRSSLGYQTVFKNGNDLKLLLLDKKNNNTLISLLIDKSQSDPYIYTIPFEELKFFKKTNKKSLDLLQSKDFIYTGIGQIDINNKEQICIFIGIDRTFDLRINNIRNLKGPRKIGSQSIGFMNIKL